MLYNDKILIGKNDDTELAILPNMANRHGLITGASGTGKTITLKVMAESFSEAGVPVFMADVKGDLASTAIEGSLEKIQSRVEKLNLDGFKTNFYPVHFWDLYGKNGHPIRANIGQVGPEILSIMLGLTEAQEGNLTIAFAIAKDKDLPLVDLSDLKALLVHVSENRAEYVSTYGNITTQSIGVIQRSLLSLENQGAGHFFGEPALDINDFFTTNAQDGRGFINILHAVELFQNPDLYAAFLLWLLTRLFTESPEVGDLDKPRMVFFFDEAHLLFNGMPAYRLKRITQVVKLIRSRGIGLYYVSQAPTDIPGEVLSQLSNRVQHALRAYTPAEQKTIKAAADAFRTNPKFNTEEAISELGTGEALISFLDEKGAPQIVERATILPPQSQMGTLDEGLRAKIIQYSNLHGKYDEALNPISAQEILNGKPVEEAQPMPEVQAAEQQNAINTNLMPSGAETHVPAASVSTAAPTAQPATRPMTETEKFMAQKQEMAARKQALAEQKLALQEQKLANQKAKEEAKAAEQAAKQKAKSQGKIEKTLTTGLQRGVTNAISSGVKSAITKGLKGIFK